MKFQQRILQVIRDPKGLLSEFEFNVLASATFEFQKKNNPIYARYCAALGITSIRRWQDIPALPVAAFKSHRVAAFVRKQAKKTFRTSGTTQGKRGAHEFADLRLYDATVKRLFAEHVMRGMKKMRMVFLVPSPTELPDSSLSYMAGKVQKFFGKGRPHWGMRKGKLNEQRLTDHLQQVKGPVLIFTTSFALAAFLDFLKANHLKLRLPKGSMLMETGGFKGRHKEVSKAQQRRNMHLYMGLSSKSIVSEYGMTELTSQFYNGRSGSWTRVLLVNPVTGKPAKQGLIRILDLANQGSAAMIQTEDIGRWISGGFEVLGRAKEAELRGCSLTFEEMQHA